MFTWLNKQGVRSDAGFEVQRVARFSLEYREGARRITLAVEPGVAEGGPCLIVGRRALARWDGDPAGATVAEEAQAAMLRNLKAALEFQGYVLVVEEDW